MAIIQIWYGYNADNDLFINWQAIKHENNCLTQIGNAHKQSYRKLGIRPQSTLAVISLLCTFPLETLSHMGCIRHQIAKYLVVIGLIAHSLSILIEADCWQYTKDRSWPSDKVLWSTTIFGLFQSSFSALFMFFLITPKAVCRICADHIQLCAVAECKLLSQSEIALANIQPVIPEYSLTFYGTCSLAINRPLLPLLLVLSQFQTNSNQPPTVTNCRAFFHQQQTMLYCMCLEA